MIKALTSSRLLSAKLKPKHKKFNSVRQVDDVTVILGQGISSLSAKFGSQSFWAYFEVRPNFFNCFPSTFSENYSDDVTTLSHFGSKEDKIKK